MKEDHASLKQPKKFNQLLITYWLASLFDKLKYRKNTKTETKDFGWTFSQSTSYNIMSIDLHLSKEKNVFLPQMITKPVLSSLQFHLNFI